MFGAMPFRQLVAKGPWRGSKSVLDCLGFKLVEKVGGEGLKPKTIILFIF